MSATWWSEEAARRQPFDWEKFERQTMRVLEVLAAGAVEAERFRKQWEAAAKGWSEASSATSASDHEAEAAAELLGVNVNSTVAEVRSALRTKMTASRVHPDHGGDGTLARELTAAKNLLTERAKVRS